LVLAVTCVMGRSLLNLISNPKKTQKVADCLQQP
jgi:hypothetical protein